MQVLESHVYRNVLWLPKLSCTALLCGWQQELVECSSGQESRSVQHWGYSVRLASVPLILAVSVVVPLPGLEKSQRWQLIVLGKDSHGQ